MGGGGGGGEGEISPYIPEKLKNMLFPKIFESCAKMFWKTSLDQSSVILPPFTHSFPPLSHINVGYFDDPSSCNTEITFFNIDMGLGGGGGGDQSIYPWKAENMLFPKIFAHYCSTLFLLRDFGSIFTFKTKITWKQLEE